ncbi:unnamed protein product (macronuclear) [Paramecium tetraurelia]|uniref:Carboxypeptidase n=1 Tax=Paramecium tetraurelia TaxID=5888 RepID=A0EA73_PARTE|nr:uncharacterized protein GSPATT00024922001 [Paramecium tetraurelia]CAK92190.1 unnamed protein product [Paramecium tetraurelia]|eukprot:XP_001459587.1 hypothetical protein (macronuclear) [Paramecium tetraurelia strain d4-2]
MSLSLSEALQAGVDNADIVDKNKLNQLFNINYQGDLQDSIQVFRYSGYLKADAQGTTQFYYLFYPAANDSLKKPIILWLNGGPGCSSIQGAFNENGPFVFKAGTSEFELNKYSWTNFANMIYLESPISVGFSYGPQVQQSDESTAKYNLQALIDFFNKFPEYKTSPLFLAGESFGGVYVPTLTIEIIDYNSKQSAEGRINLQGLAIGNGCTDPTECTHAAWQFQVHVFHQVGRHNFISEELYEKVRSVEKQCVEVKTDICRQISQEVEEQITGKDQQVKANQYNIYGPCYTYTPEGSKRASKSHGLMSYTEDADIPACADIQGLYHHLRSNQVRDLLHIKAESAEWEVCSKKFVDYQENPKGSYYLYEEILKHQIKVLIYSGDVDGVVPVTGTMYWLNKLQKELSLLTLNPWRPWFVPGKRDVDGNQNAGYVVDLDGLTFMTIRNAGHMVPLDKREEAEVFMAKFVKHELFP